MVFTDPRLNLEVPAPPETWSTDRSPNTPVRQQICLPGSILLRLSMPLGSLCSLG